MSWEGPARLVATIGRIWEIDGRESGFDAFSSIFNFFGYFNLDLDWKWLALLVVLVVVEMGM